VKMGVEYNRSMGDELTAAMPPRHPPSKNRRPPSRVVDEDRNEEGTEQIERRESQKSNSVSSSGSHMSETHKKRCGGWANSRRSQIERPPKSCEQQPRIACVTYSFPVIL
jgi:hypothetical protein